MFYWFGPNPSLIVTNPEQAREVLTKSDSFPKPQSSNPLPRLLVKGVVSYEGEKWAKHRKIINPAFHLDKLKVLYVL